MNASIEDQFLVDSKSRAKLLSARHKIIGITVFIICSILWICDSLWYLSIAD